MAITLQNPIFALQFIKIDKYVTNSIQTKGRLHEESMDLLASVGIKLTSGKRKLLTQAKNFPCEVLFLRDDDIPEAVADGVADIGIVGENEYLEKQKEAQVEKRLGYSKCRMSLAIPKGEAYENIKWFNGKKIATSYPVILEKYLTENGVKAEGWKDYDESGNEIK